MNPIGFHIDLFSGIGGFSLAFEAQGFETILFCEYDKQRQKDLKHHWPKIPIVADVNDVDAICRIVADAKGRQGEEIQQGFREVPIRDGGKSPAESRVVDDTARQQNNSAEPGRLHAESGCTSNKPFILTAGVPCQPASSAGKRKGSADDRWLWPQTISVVERTKPDFVVFENPLGLASLAQSAAIAGMAIDRLREVSGRTICEILTRLDALGYELPCDRDGIPWIPVVPAAGIGAFHGRDRLWIIGRSRNVGDAKYNGFNAAENREGNKTRNGNFEAGQNSTGQLTRSSSSSSRCSNVGNAESEYVNGGWRTRGRIGQHSDTGEKSFTNRGGGWTN